MSNKTIILFMAHYLTGAILDEYRRIKKSCKPKHKLVMLYDNTRNDFAPSQFENEQEYFLFDASDVNQRFQLNKSDEKVNIVPGNCLYPILMFADAVPNFEFIWRVEYDVRYNGEWNLFFDHFADNASDLLATTLFRYGFRPDWSWWKSLKKPGERPAFEQMVRGFLPVFRLSHQALRILAQAHNEGWRGHYEVAIPTILQYYGCTLEDIGGDGEFVEPQNRNRFYTNTPAYPGLAPGTFVCPPNECDKLESPNKLYHPVKQ